MKLQLDKGVFLVASLAAVIFLSGCTSDRSRLGEDVIRLTIADENSGYIRKAGVYFEEGKAIVRGRVRRGNVSHIPHYYLGHIDLFVFDEKGALVETGLVELGGRQQRFFYYLKAVSHGGGTVRLYYHRRAHVAEHELYKGVGASGAEVSARRQQKIKTEA